MLETQKNWASFLFYLQFFATLRCAIDTSFYERTGLSIFLIAYWILYVEITNFWDNGYE